MRTTQTERSLALPPGNFGLPLIGETISFLRDPSFSQKRYKRYGPIFKTHLFGRPTVVLIGAEANRFLFTNENQYFSVGWPGSTKILFGASSLVSQTGDEHQKRRKLLSQAFQSRTLVKYVSSMADTIHSYLHKWENMGTLTWYAELKKYTFDVACKFIIGTDVASDNHFEELFKDYSNGIFSFPVRLPWTRFSRALGCRKQLLVKIEEIVRQRQQQPNTNEDALGIMMQARDEDGNELSLQELKEQVLLLMFAGHETMTSALTSFCLLLAQHPEVLATARAEQQQLGFEEPLTLEHLKQMTYLEQVLKEVLRIIPPVPPVGGGFRETIKPCEFNGYSIPQGWNALYQIITTHKDSRVYTQPERFDPQRFAPERAEDKSKLFSHIPFGGGVRECIGKEFAKLEMKLFAALLVRKYEWELLPEQNLDIVLMPLAHPRDGLQVKLRRLV
jgi:cytochrome P450